MSSQLRFGPPVRRSEPKHAKPVRLTRRGEAAAVAALLVGLLALLALVGGLEAGTL